MIRFKLLTIGILTIFLGSCHKKDIKIRGTIVPESSGYNQNIAWESVFTDGNPGKVNRGIVDTDGNAIVIFMPDNESRIHKIDGDNGDRIWTITISNTIGFGISEINDSEQCDYIVSGGIGPNHERWVARLNGNDGSIIWSKTYTAGSNGGFDAVRMTMISSDGYIYGSGFIDADEGNSIFVVYGGQAMVMKIDPNNGNEIWTHTNQKTDYAMAVIEDADGNIFYGSTMFEQDLTLTKLDPTGSESWTRNLPNTTVIIPADMCIDSYNAIYFGGHSGRRGKGDPFDYSCLKMDTEGTVEWVKHYANPRGYSLKYIRNELYAIQVGADGIYMFGGSGVESKGYNKTISPFPNANIWVGWVLKINEKGTITKSDTYCHDNSNTATEYGCLTDDGYIIFNDTDAHGDTEVGVMKIVQ